MCRWVWSPFMEIREEQSEKMTFIQELLKIIENKNMYILIYISTSGEL